MKKLFKKKYLTESRAFKVSAFISPGGFKVERFQDCSVVLVSPTDPFDDGPSLPHSRRIFMAGTKIGDAFVEVIKRFPLNGPCAR